MTEKQIDEVLAKCEKSRGQTEMLGILICLFTGGVIAWFAFTTIWLVLVLGVLPALIGYELWEQFNAAMKNRNAWALWDEFVARTSSLESTSEPMRLLAKRIRALYEQSHTDHILPLHMAARLADTYGKQLNLMEQIKTRLQENESIYKKLNENVARLAELETVHESSQSSLRELEEDREELLRVQSKIETSMRHLEGVLERAEIEAQKRLLHAEVTKLTQTVKSTTATEKPELYIGEVVSDLEQQISSEVAHYLRLEQEIETQLR